MDFFNHFLFKLIHYDKKLFMGIALFLPLFTFAQNEQHGEELEAATNFSGLLNSAVVEGRASCARHHNTFSIRYISRYSFHLF